MGVYILNNRNLL